MVLPAQPSAKDTRGARSYLPGYYLTCGRPSGRPHLPLLPR